MFSSVEQKLCVCLREREKRYYSFTPPSSLGLDVFLMAQLDPSASCPYFTPATRTPPFYFSLSVSLSLWSGLGQGQCKNREFIKIWQRKTSVCVCVSESVVVGDVRYLRLWILLYNVIFAFRGWG